MQTLYLDPAADENAVQTAADLLLQGEIVGMPTETVYGLAANALNGPAVRKIFAAKGRPQDNPLIVHVSDFDQIPALVSAIPEAAKKLAEAFWPGPMTMILPKGENILDEVSAGLDTVGIRMPSHPMARALIRQAGVPLAAPSANLSGRPSTTTAQHVLEDLSGKIAAVLEGGSCSVGVESTVISLAVQPPRLLRPGGISLEQLRSVLGEVEVDKALYQKIDDSTKVSAPGMKYRHYAPKAAVTVFTGDPDQTARCIGRFAGESSGVLCFDEYERDFPQAGTVLTFGSRDNVAGQAQNVFDALRHFDETSVTEIYAQCPDDRGIGLAVANRLKKAAGFHVIALPKVKIIGLTGGSGAGKGAAAAAFAQLGISAVDADAVYHQLLIENTAMLREIAQRFGKDVLDSQGMLLRKKLGARVFGNPQALRELSAMTDPYILEACFARMEALAQQGAKMVLFDAPTLFQTGGNRYCDRVLSVLAPEEMRIQRIMQRDEVSREYAASRIYAQPKDDWYRERSDHILVNDGDLDKLQKQALDVWESLKKE